MICYGCKVSMLVLYGDVIRLGSTIFMHCTVCAFACNPIGYHMFINTFLFPLFVLMCILIVVG